MSTTAGFRVVISGLRIKDLCLNRSSPPDVYVAVNFDNYFTWQTSVKNRTHQPNWSDEEPADFVYSTRFVNKLRRKHLKLDVYHKRSWRSDSHLGHVQVDLHTLACGPVDHRGLRVLDGGRTVGLLDVSVSMREVTELQINLKDVEVMCPNYEAVRSSAYLRYTYTGYDDPPASAKQTRTRGRCKWDYLDQLYAKVHLDEMLISSIVFTLMNDTSRFGSDTEIGTAMVPIADVFTFTDGKAMPFRVPIVGAEGEISGEVFFRGVPQYAQMIGGWHDPAGIHCARPAAAGEHIMPHVPDCPINRGRAVTTTAAAAASAARRGGPRRVPPSPHMPMPPAPGTPHSGALGYPTRRDPSHPPAASAGGAGFDAYSTLSAAGPGHPPSSVAAAGGASAGAMFGALSAPPTPGSPRGYTLPPHWGRAVAPDGRPYFLNHVWHYTCWQLPTKPEYRVTFTKPGPLGLQVGACFAQSGSGALGMGASRDQGVLVTGVVPGSPAERARLIKPGHQIIAINGASSLGWDTPTTVRVLSSATRPVTLRFFDPHHVSPAVAAMALHHPPSSG